MSYSILTICQSEELLESIKTSLSFDSNNFSLQGFLKVDSIEDICQQSKFDLVLFDYNLTPFVIKGYLGAMQLCPHFRRIAVVVTADQFNDQIKDILDSGIDDFIELPINPRTLITRLLINIKRSKTIENLEIQSEQFRDISLAASQAGTSLIIINSKGEISWVNEGFELLYECSIDEFREQFGGNVFEGHSNSKTIEAMRRCRENGDYVVYESLWYTKSNQRKYIQTSLTPIYDHTGRFSKIIAIEMDITDLKLAESALSDKHDNLLSTMEHLELANEMLDKQRIEIEKQKESLENEKQKTDSLLLNILPEVAAHQLKKKGFVKPKNYSQVSVLFADFVNFSNISISYESIEDFLTALSFYFEAFDEITTRRFIEKIKTIGDCYMCVGGVPQMNKSHAFDTVLAGLEIQKFVEEIAKKDQEQGKPVWRLRIGIHTGSVMAGVIGKKKFAYDIWGETVNVASRMETNGEAGKVNVSETTYQYIKDYFKCTFRGKVPAKSIGEINMYFVERILPEFSEDEYGYIPNANFRKELAKY